MPVDPGARSAPKKAAKDASQRQKATARDGKRCVAEKKIGRAWMPCGAEAHATAHVYRRWKCGPVSDHEDVVVRTCVECHDKIDNRIPNEDPEVRVPLAYQRRAWDRIAASCKETSVLGPRP